LVDAARARPEASPAGQHEHSHTPPNTTNYLAPARGWLSRARSGTMSTVRARLAALATAAAIVAAAAIPRPHAQQQPLRDDRPFKSGVEIISIAATVTDAEGHLVTSLPREAFEVFEDGERQAVTQFTNERVPLGLGLLLDISDSMFGKRI